MPSLEDVTNGAAVHSVSSGSCHSHGVQQRSLKNTVHSRVLRVSPFLTEPHARFPRETTSLLNVTLRCDEGGSICQLQWLQSPSDLACFTSRRDDGDDLGEFLEPKTIHIQASRACPLPSSHTDFSPLDLSVMNSPHTWCCSVSHTNPSGSQLPHRVCHILAALALCQQLWLAPNKGLATTQIFVAFKWRYQKFAWNVQSRIAWQSCPGQASTRRDFH